MNLIVAKIVVRPILDFIGYTTVWDDLAALYQEIRNFELTGPLLGIALLVFVQMIPNRKNLKMSQKTSLLNLGQGAAISGLKVTNNEMSGTNVGPLMTAGDNASITDAEFSGNKITQTTPRKSARRR